MDNWDEIRTAFQVARLGTVSGAADVLGVHHATVIRHIDALEKRLGAKLFQRHARGYTPTEAGRDLLSVAQTTEDQFSQLANRIKGQGEVVSGELLVTAITGISDLLAPIFAGFQAAHPQVVIRFLTDMRVFRLDFGEAHVAIRAGTQPQEPDYVVAPLARLRFGLYASRAYAEANGLPVGPEDFHRHRFIGHDDPESRAPFYRWLRDHVSNDAMAFRITESDATREAIRTGLGIGFLPYRHGNHDPDLVEVMAPLPDWDAPLWLVTHVDLHRTLKVQSFLGHLRTAAAGWNGI